MNAANENYPEGKKPPHQNKTKALQLLVNDSQHVEGEKKQKKTLLMQPNCKGDEQRRKTRLLIILGGEGGMITRNPSGAMGVFSGRLAELQR